MFFSCSSALNAELKQRVNVELFLTEFISTPVNVRSHTGTA